MQIVDPKQLFTLPVGTEKQWALRDVDSTSTWLCVFGWFSSSESEEVLPFALCIFGLSQLSIVSVIFSPGFLFCSWNENAKVIKSDALGPFGY